MNGSNQEVIRSRVIKAQRLEPGLANALLGGQVLVYNWTG